MILYLKTWLYDIMYDITCVCTQYYLAIVHVILCARMTQGSIRRTDTKIFGSKHTTHRCDSTTRV